MEHDPGPRGSPHIPHAAISAGEAGEVVSAGLPWEKTESFFSSFVPWHDGHSGVTAARTSASNDLLQSWQTYS